MLTRCRFHRILCWPRSFSSKPLDPQRTSPATSTAASGSESIFSKSASPWDHVFDDIQDMPPLIPTHFHNTLREASDVNNTARKYNRRQSMTAREINAFDEMFNMIFDAVSEHKNKITDRDANGSRNTIGIGRAPDGSGLELNDFYSRMRGHSRRLRWSPRSDEELDRKKEEMELCDTDQQLLEWAMREVFGESKRYELAAQKAISEMVAGKQSETLPELQPAVYPHLVAHLIRVFRDKYRDPHLALSMFNHARHLSIPSYVFGCTTPAYNELIRTRWKCFRDLKGIHSALEEMTVNGIEPDNQTRMLVEEVRRQVGERNKWEEENDLGSGEVWAMLNNIDRLMVRQGPRFNPHGQRQSKPFNEAWKKDALQSNKLDDDWAFDRWDVKGSLGP